MERHGSVAERTLSSRPHSKAPRPALRWLGIASLVLLALAAAAAEILLRRAEPVLRAMVIQSLSARFNGRVELGEFHVSLLRGFEAIGTNLAVYPRGLPASQPAISIDRFSFRTDYFDILRSPLRVGLVEVDRLQVRLPPKSARTGAPGQHADQPASPTGRGGMPAISVQRIRCTNAILTIETDKPGKVPETFAIKRLVLSSLAPGKPLNFTATLTNPRPIGDIQSSGYFGPWNSRDPGSSVVGGAYSFQHADLGTLRGIAGTLSSEGRYRGTLDNIVVDGSTETPDFEIKLSGHKVPLHTEFHAIVDGLTGDTYLQPVKARFLRSTVVANGTVVRSPDPPGHRIDLDIAIDQARIEDLLLLAVRTTPPLLTGAVRMHAKLLIPPGPRNVARKLTLNGRFDVWSAHFSNPKFQADVDRLSLRSQGDPRGAARLGSDPQAGRIASEMQSDFNLADGMLTIVNLNYTVPGAVIKLNGAYSQDGASLDLTGTADLEATMSQMVGGWKGVFLKPFDHYLEKNGAGTEVPFRIKGTRSEPQLSLDFHRRHLPGAGPNSGPNSDGSDLRPQPQRQ